MKKLLDEVRTAWKLYLLMFIPGSLFAVPMIAYKLFAKTDVTWLQVTTPIWVPLLGLLIVACGYMGLSMVFAASDFIRGKCGH